MGIGVGLRRARGGEATLEGRTVDLRDFFRLCFYFGEIYLEEMLDVRDGPGNGP